jgi:hypothetical protein
MCQRTLLALKRRNHLPGNVMRAFPRVSLAPLLDQAFHVLVGRFADRG